MLCPLEHRHSSSRCTATRNVPDRPGVKVLTSEEVSYRAVGTGHVAQVSRPEAFCVHVCDQAKLSLIASC
jgi:hypothetical protein